MSKKYPLPLKVNDMALKVDQLKFHQMKTFIKPVLILLVLLGLHSCSKTKERSQNGEEKDTVQESPEETSATEDEGVEPDFSVRKILFEDFDNNGVKDSLVLSTNAEVDDMGRIAWDDSQKWKVTIKYNNQSKQLYKKDIQLGKLDVYFSADLGVIYLVENAPYQKDVFKVKPNESFTLSEITESPDLKKFKLLSIQ